MSFTHLQYLPVKSDHSLKPTPSLHCQSQFQEKSLQTALIAFHNYTPLLFLGLRNALKTLACI